MAAKPAANYQANLRDRTLGALDTKLAKLGIRRDFDLVLHLPLRYEDETMLTPIAEAAPGCPVQVEGSVIDTDIVYRPRRQLVCRLRDASGELVLRFMNFYPNQKNALAPQARVRAFGEVREGFLGAEMIHPRFRVLHGEAPLAATLTPVYPTTAALPQQALRTLIGKALAGADLSDTLPEALRERLGLMRFAAAVTLLHHPQPDSDGEALGSRTHPAWQRIKFDELLAQQLSMRRHYRERKSKAAIALEAKGSHVGALLGRLPFTLTGAQVRVWGEIGADIAQPRPMHRLLQGDVGSGKTIVAALACLRAVENGVQAAVMAPTEILAEQHYRKFSEWLLPLGVRLAWLSGSQAKAERDAALRSIASGETQVAIGTHALFQKQVAFSALGLVIVDEQHRFGVAQRLALRRKGKGKGKGKGREALAGIEPHLLMMSATPIPRTLSMSYYADLDVSVIDELPPGRSPVVTKLISDARRDEVVRRIREACQGGQQAYWVCPLIEESEALQLKTALDTHAQLEREFPELSVGLMHGRLKPEEKAGVMSAFIGGTIHLLVATTVIEVGVDVANASLMVIEHAERFGLAQLHQLRGRVGRGAAESVCVLLYQSPLGELARNRLKAIYESTDGFEIARQDLAIRGPGEYLGSRQSGVPLLRFADLERDLGLLEAARDAAELMLRDNPQAARNHLERWLGGRGEFLKA
ncbi:MAG: ATP-dependent DNA helicase RecG [Betaproteobacteria bacterium]|nr:ATP-dependent DNA helicase RecG [Betaproteobacteria bacterium]